MLLLLGSSLCFGPSLVCRWSVVRFVCRPWGSILPLDPPFSYSLLLHLDFFTSLSLFVCIDAEGEIKASFILESSAAISLLRACFSEESSTVFVFLCSYGSLQGFLHLDLQQGKSPIIVEHVLLKLTLSLLDMLLCLLQRRLYSPELMCLSLMHPVVVLGYSQVVIVRDACDSNSLLDDILV